VFGASNYGAHKDEQFPGNSSIFMEKPPDIQLDIEPNIMDIESTSFGLKVPHGS